MDTENDTENENLKIELANLKNQLELLKNPISIKKKRGRPNNPDKIPRSEYMKNYMKMYNEKHKEKQNLRYNTYYYLKNSDMPKDFINKYDHYACLVYKTKMNICKIKEICPQFLSDVIL